MGDAELLAEVLGVLGDWVVSWYPEPYEGWDGSLWAVTGGPDGVTVTVEQVEAMRRFGIEVADG